MYCVYVTMPFAKELYTFDARTGQGLVLFGSDSKLSNSSTSPITIHGQTYQTVQQYYQFEKALYFFDIDTARKILRNASDSQKMGQTVKNYNSTEWKTVAMDVMLRAVTEKHLQNREARAELLNTGNDTIVHANEFDTFWGIGLAMDDKRSKDVLEWKGMNKLGSILMIVREILL